VYTVLRRQVFRSNSGCFLKYMRGLYAGNVSVESRFQRVCKLFKRVVRFNPRKLFLFIMHARKVFRFDQGLLRRSLCRMSRRGILDAVRFGGLSSMRCRHLRDDIWFFSLHSVPAGAIFRIYSGHVFRFLPKLQYRNLFFRVWIHGNALLYAMPTRNIH
jgi:hypothetical protein